MNKAAIDLMSNSPDFLQPLLELMQRNAERQDKNIEKLDRKIDTNTALTNKIHEQTKKTNGRVNAHDRELAELTLKLNKLLPAEAKVDPKTIAPWYRDPLILKIILYIALGGLLVIGAVVGVDIGGLL